MLAPVIETETEDKNKLQARAQHVVPKPPSSFIVYTINVKT